MIYNRPPLNCQKCQFRFFTDQGLERHLLGSHGLVTASMQDAANKGQDSGRCPVCGKVGPTPTSQSRHSSLSYSGLPVEVAEPRGQGPRQDSEAGTSLLQMHSLHGDVWSVQAFWEPRVHRSLGGRQESWQEQTGNRLTIKTLDAVLLWSTPNSEVTILLCQAAKTGGSVLKSAVKLSDEISIIPTKKDSKEQASFVHALKVCCLI